MKILITTDAHGWGGFTRAQQWAKFEKVKAVIITGDCYNVGSNCEIETHCIRGNRENEAEWSHRGKNVVLHEDFTQFSLDGLKFGVLGRMDETSHAHLSHLYLGEKHNRAFEHRSDGSQFLAGSDILLFHDAPKPFIIHEEMRGSLYLTSILETVRPYAVFHGHMHQFQPRIINDIQVVGLAPCDPDFKEVNYAILNTSELTIDLKMKYPAKSIGGLL